jgi:hypothetical protein
VVVLVLIGVAGFVGIFALIPDDEPESRSALLSVITVTASGILAWVVNRKVNAVQDDVSAVGREVGTVKRLVNGNTARLIDKLPAGEQELERDVHEKIMRENA